MRIDKYLKVTHIIKRREVAKKMLDAGFVSINDKNGRSEFRGTIKQEFKLVTD